ncbi:helix-turn-helix domain-containing protein [Bacilliculturomica massiliensis]|uniref:helix-turn-helix domain-containing protein n=1 Tax=Bacilliculturomica massiliensis TaxID=1917867 RepID=UPI001FEBAE41|nr:helix-turn-helix transcriptional regulator [Bacilliculturomica massiliensis]
MKVMDAAELGKRIKEARLARKMTQSEVVGDFITRNMLSQIEGGTATPSIRTLEYLCEVLNVPMKQLVVDSPEDELDLLLRAKGLLSKGEYARTIELCRGYPKELSDEFCAILARACLGNARKEAAQGNLKEAAALTESALDHSQKGIYANDTLKTEALLFLNEVAEKLSSYYLKRIGENSGAGSENH